jgi:hypothetical protein
MQQAHFLLDPLSRRGLLLAEEGFVALGRDRTEGDRVYSDAPRPVLDRQRACQSFDRGLLP